MTERHTARQLAVSTIKANAAVLAIIGDASHVYDTRGSDFHEEELASVDVSTPSTRWEKSRDQNGHPVYKRRWVFVIECVVSVDEGDGDDPDAVDALLAQRVDELETATINALLTSGPFVAVFEELGELDGRSSVDTDKRGRFGQSLVTFDATTRDAYNPDLTGADELHKIAMSVFDEFDDDGEPVDPPLTEAEIPIEPAT